MGVHRVCLSLGSNVGDRARHLRDAVKALESCGLVRVVSPVYETEPAGELNQPAFLNAAVEIETALEPLGLLNAVKAIENALGRLPRQHWGPREIDIDLVLWGDRVLSSGALTLPHAAFRTRRFVLAPLADIVPGQRDPVTDLSIAALLRQPEAQGQVFKTDIAICP